MRSVPKVANRPLVRKHHKVRNHERSSFACLEPLRKLLTVSKLQMSARLPRYKITTASSPHLAHYTIEFEQQSILHVRKSNEGL